MDPGRGRPPPVEAPQELPRSPDPLRHLRGRRRARLPARLAVAAGRSGPLLGVRGASGGEDRPPPPVEHPLLLHHLCRRRRAHPVGAG